MSSPSAPAPAARPSDANAASDAAAAGARFCTSCGAQLSAGARFCHRCGAAVDGGPPGDAGARGAGGDRGVAGVMPWAVAFMALLAVVAMTAGRNFGAAKGSAVDGSANALPQAALGEVAAAPVAPPTCRR